jgi:hypothetical protein
VHGTKLTKEVPVSLTGFSIWDLLTKITKCLAWPLNSDPFAFGSKSNKSDGCAALEYKTSEDINSVGTD